MWWRRFENDAEVVDSEQDHLQHGGGFRSTLGWRDAAKCGGSGNETAECVLFDKINLESEVSGARQLPPATVVHAPCAQATYRRWPRHPKENDGVALQPPRIVCHAVDQQGVRLGN